MRQALLKARAKGSKDVSGPDIQRIVINMERWRWMPANSAPTRTSPSSSVAW